MKKLKKEKQLKSNKGITLIALVITIIVLLILAGVSIAMLTGQNGILTQAQNAKNRTEEAQAEEKNRLNEYNNIINNYVNGGTTTGGDEEESGEQAVVGEKVTGGNKPYTNNGTAIIPEGFAIVPGLNDVSQGLVISDVANDTENTGNQFVWVPVEKGKYIRNTSYEYAGVSTTAYSDTGYLPDGIQPTIPEGTEDPEAIGLINEGKEREVVENAGGFYISRYEAGKERTDTLVSKKEATVWTSIAVEDDKSNEEVKGCKTVAKTFINNDNVKSALCSGIQWDMAMAFITAKDDSYSVTESTSSWHKGSSPAKAGANPEDIACNIYDLEGNCYEYVAEKSSNNQYVPFVYRGGGYTNSNPASSRGSSIGVASTNNSFRFVLYVM